MQTAAAMTGEGVFYPSPAAFPLDWAQADGKRGRGVNWGTEETEILLDIYKQRQQTHAGNIHIYKLISEDMSDRGFFRSPAQCKTRIHTLKRYYGNTALEGQIKGGNSSRLDAIFLGDGSDSSSADASAAKKPRLDDMSADGDVEISFPQVKIERIDDDEEYADLEVTMGNPAGNRSGANPTSFGQISAGVAVTSTDSVFAPTSVDQTLKNRARHVPNVSLATLEHNSSTLCNSETGLETSPGISNVTSVTSFQANGMVNSGASVSGLSAENMKQKVSANPSAVENNIDSIEVEDVQFSSNKSGNLIDVSVTDPEDERRGIEQARTNWIERMKSHGLYKTAAPAPTGVGALSDANPRMRQPMEMMDQRMRGNDHGFLTEPMYNPRSRMFPNVASIPSQNPTNLSPMTRLRAVTLAAAATNPPTDGLGDGCYNNHGANQVTVMEKLIAHLQHTQNRYVELESRRLDLEEKRLEMERKKMDTEERQRREEREHQLHMMQLVLGTAQRRLCKSPTSATLENPGEQPRKASSGDEPSNEST